MTHIYQGGLPEGLKSLSEASEEQLEGIKNSLDAFAQIYTHVWIEFDKEAFERAIEVIVAKHGFKVDEIRHRYAVETTSEVQ